MNVQKLSFHNRHGERLQALLELPFQEKPNAYALFAHCFTCGKNLPAADKISHALAMKGIAVLRFDFMGLGESGGDFEHSNFSTNITDIEDAAQYMQEAYEAPALLIGHSLGGTAVLFSAKNISSVKGIVTIGAPATPEHVLQLFGDEKAEILQNEKATFLLAGKEITIRKHFIEDVESLDVKALLEDVRVPLLILHAPGDNMVGIENAAKIYEYAHHPKSFVSLDDADHLLKKEKDAKYVSEVIASWASRYLDFPEQQLPEGQVNAWLGSSGFTTELLARSHSWLADEPMTSGGKDLGPTPYELLSAALATCTAMTLRMYAKQKKWDIGAVKVSVSHGRQYAADCKECEEQDSNISHFKRMIQFSPQVDADQKIRLISIADRCPVHKTLSKASHITTSSFQQQ